MTVFFFESKTACVTRSSESSSSARHSSRSTGRCAELEALFSLDLAGESEILPVWRERVTRPGAGCSRRCWCLGLRLRPKMASRQSERGRNSSIGSPAYALRRQERSGVEW